MTRLRRLASRAADLVARALAPLRPEPGTTEGVVMLGLVLVAGGFAAAGFVPLALGVPGAALVAIGLGFSFRRAA